MNKKNVHYVDNKEFYNAIVEYKKEIARTEELGLDKVEINNALFELTQGGEIYRPNSKIIRISDKL